MGKIQRRNTWFLFLLDTSVATQFVLELPVGVPISVAGMTANTVIPLECFKA
jgi:hypothetical protein